MNTRKSLTILLLLSLAVPVGYSYGQDVEDQFERKMWFVDMVAQATGLYNSGQTERALEIFEQIDAKLGQANTLQALGDLAGRPCRANG